MELTLLFWELETWVCIHWLLKSLKHISKTYFFLCVTEKFIDLEKLIVLLIHSSEACASLDFKKFCRLTSTKTDKISIWKH